MTPELQQRIEDLVQQNKIMVFMKGNMLGAPYETIDVLADPEIRDGIKEFSSWPTIPQVYVNGEFLGGSDIMIELYQKGELQQMVEVALAS
jgi:monothiol glutaredoxin